MRPPTHARSVIRGLVVAGVTVAFTCATPPIATAQEVPSTPSSATEAQGLVGEPAIITRAVLFADRHQGKGDLTNGFFFEFGQMIPGAGWLSVGPGYRQWFGKDQLLAEGSASYSLRGYKAAQARFELPKILRSRLALGSQVRWQDQSQIDYFGTARAPRWRTAPSTACKRRISSALRPCARCAGWS